MADKPPRWDVEITLDDWPEHHPVRAASPEAAAWAVALDMADRGFGERVALVAVEALPDLGALRERPA